jgi:type II secretion system protein C
MARMQPRQQRLLDWRQRAPLWTAVALGCLLMADLVHFASLLRRHAEPQTSRFDQAQSRVAIFEVQKVVSAHLFGAEPPGAEAGGAPPVTLALSGVIATGDPNQGYAILGERGKSTHLYRTGETLTDAPGARLYQVFSDRALLAFGERIETLSLPRQLAAGLVRRVELISEQPRPMVAQNTPDIPKVPPTAAQSAFGQLDAEADHQNGRFAGMLLHPQVRLRKYVHEGDRLLAVNGVALTDADTVESALKTSGKSMSLTVLRDGSQQTLNVPINE